ncbi:hypothetical protein Q1695_000924 [Nippostrongylus brasiliensis]|nr:hypothetical protein Q1695_000924 [Nippostrongylus brasiliensis]
MRNSATLTRMLYKEIRRENVDLITTDKGPVYELMNEIALIRKPRNKRMKAKRGKIRRGKSYSSQSASDEQQISQREQHQQSCNPIGIKEAYDRRIKMLDEILDIYEKIPNDTIKDFHESVKKYVFESYGPTAFYMDEQNRRLQCCSRRF